MAAHVDKIPFTPLTDFLPVIEARYGKALAKATGDSMPLKRYRAAAVKAALLAFLQQAQKYSDLHGERYGPVGRVAVIGKDYYMPAASGKEDPEVAGACIGIIPLGHVDAYVVNLGSKTKINIVSNCTKAGKDGESVRSPESFNFTRKAESTKFKIWRVDQLSQIQIITARATYVIPRTDFPDDLHPLKDPGFDEELTFFTEDAQQLAQQFGKFSGPAHRALGRTLMYAKIALMDPLALKCWMKSLDIKNVISAYSQANRVDLQYTGSPAEEEKIARTAYKIYILSLLQTAVATDQATHMVVIGRTHSLPPSETAPSIDLSRFVLGLLNLPVGPAVINMGGRNFVSYHQGTQVKNLSFSPKRLCYELLGHINKLCIVENETTQYEISRSDFPYEAKRNLTHGVDNWSGKSMLKFLGKVDVQAAEYCESHAASDELKEAVRLVGYQTQIA